MDRDEIIYICPECGYEDRALFYSSDSSDFRAGDTQSYNADRERGMLEKVCPECSRSTLTRKQWHLEHLKKLTGIEGLTMEDFLSALEQGPDYFNSWSSDKDLFEQIYAGVDLRRYDLRGIRLRNCSFKEAIVKGCDFSNAKFYKADFSGADWTGCCFHKVAFYDSKLNSIKCENAEFSNCNASLGASFEHSIMNGCNFSEARLRHVSFAFCSLQNSCFKNADIEGASFARADLSHADMRTAKIDTDSYLKPKKPDFMLAVTENAIFNEGEHPAGHSYIHHLCEQLGASYKQEYFDGPKGDSFYTYKLKYVLDGQDDYVRELIKARLSPYFKPLIEKVQARESLDSYLRFLVQKNKERVSSGTEALLTYLEIWLRALGTDKDRASQAVTELKQNSSPVPPLPNNPQPFESWLEPLSGVEFTWLPSGTFIMGSPEDENGRQDDEGPQHEVQLDGFWIGRFPVTNLQWRAVYLLEGELPQIDHPVGTTPWRTPLKPGKSNFPVEKLRFGIPVGNYFNPATNISWDMAKQYLSKLSSVYTELNFRLPTEAEWEYGCRSGTATAFSYGPSFLRKNTRCHDNLPASVDKYPPNDFGLYGMHGNVNEWCEDVYDAEAYAKRAQDYPLKNPLVKGKDTNRVARGGSFSDKCNYTRSAFRNYLEETSSMLTVGFRMVVERKR